VSSTVIDTLTSDVVTIDRRLESFEHFEQPPQKAEGQ